LSIRRLPLLLLGCSPAGGSLDSLACPITGVSVDRVMSIPIKQLNKEWKLKVAVGSVSSDLAKLPCVGLVEC